MERVMSIAAVPSYLTTTLNVSKVKVRDADGEVRIAPIIDSPAVDRFLAIKHAAVDAEDKMTRLYDLCGSGADLSMTVDSFIAMTHGAEEMGGE